MTASCLIYRKFTDASRDYRETMGIIMVEVTVEAVGATCQPAVEVIICIRVDTIRTTMFTILAIP